MVSPVRNLVGRARSPDFPSKPLPASLLRLVGLHSKIPPCFTNILFSKYTSWRCWKVHRFSALLTHLLANWRTTVTSNPLWLANSQLYTLVYPLSSLELSFALSANL